MSGVNFSATLSVTASAQDAFDAVNNVRGWWSANIEGNTGKLGDEFTYRYQDVHVCRIRVTESLPGKRVAWKVLDNHFNFTEDKTEWRGTTMVFDFSEMEGTTEVRFTHMGLVPEYECFDVCSNAWGSYINGSLRSLISTGKGRPNPKEK